MKTPGGVAVEWFVAVLVTVFLVGFFSMPQEEYSGDPLVMRSETVSLLNTGSLEIPPSAVLPNAPKGQFFFYNETTHKWYSKYGVMNGIMYIVPLQLEKWLEGNLPYLSADRVVYLNLYNVLLSLASGAYLFVIAARYTRSGLAILIFVLTAFYCTFWWNYLRAQNSEIYQTLFMLAFYYYFTAVLSPHHPGLPVEKRKDASSLALAGIFLGLLVLVKVFYAVLLPVALLFLAHHFWRRWQDRPTGLTPSLSVPFGLACAFLIPVALAGGVLLLTNWVRFGSPFNTGYDQWHEYGVPVFGGHFWQGLHGFLFDPQESIFWYFPTLIFALPGFRNFLAKHPADGLFIVTVFLIFLLLQSKLVGWFGGWCYGPRYMLSVLPLISLPFLVTLEFLFKQIRRAWALACLAFMAGILLYSLHLQLNTNTLPFFTYFRLRDSLASLHRPDVDAYFKHRPMALISGDLLAYKSGNPWLPLEMLSPTLPPAANERLRAAVGRSIGSNYYLFPDTDNAPL